MVIRRISCEVPFMAVVDITSDVRFKILIAILPLVTLAV